MPTSVDAQVSLSSSPYLDARKEWDERYGSLITRANNWRRAAFLALLIALLQTGGLIALALKNKVVPYVVAIDNLGRMMASGPADQTTAADDKLKRAALFHWVSDLRMVTIDGVAQRKAIDRVYTMIASGSPAQVEVGDFYRLAPPHVRAQLRTVDVEVKAAFATSEKTYQVEWSETIRGLSGQVEGEERWKGSFTIAVNPPSNERLIRLNPLGIYVTNLSWSRVL
ncbi:VirB8/TrbF family protein [Bryobacter aggregatus]|uniref:VirB8/TrbF family protein n=1 Tax=Bryobacter aggregatus TaxID=360054 RepID=UPI000691CBFE|nr:VirB8/TrbF family protein [Bryobacter aggregatus]